MLINFESKKELPQIRTNEKDMIEVQCRLSTEAFGLGIKDSYQ